MQEEIKETLDKLEAEGKLFFTVDSTESAANLEPIWGNWLFRKTVIEEVGEPGISKTTFNYAFATALVNHKPFLGVDGARPHESMKILYLDLESSNSLIKSRKNMVGSPNNSNFLVCNLFGVSLYDLKPYVDKLIKQIKRVNIVFIDPLRMAFNTRDENDNAEASRQMKYLRYLTESWDCAIILVHHSSKAELTGTRKGSGAYARSGLADIVWNFENLGEDYPPDLFKLHIPKNRYIQDDLCVCIRKEEGRFYITDFPAGYSFQGSSIRIYSIQQALDVLLQDRVEREPLELLAALEKMGMATTKPTLYKAITALMQLGVVKRTSYGKYKMAGE